MLYQQKSSKMEDTLLIEELAELPLVLWNKVIATQDFKVPSLLIYTSIRGIIKSALIREESLWSRLPVKSLLELC